MWQTLTHHHSQQVQMSQSDSSVGEQSEKQKKIQTVPHLINLNEDPMLSRVIYHFLEQGKSEYIDILV